jgi:two-component system chemotaxis response regulator CheB
VNAVPASRVRNGRDVVVIGASAGGVEALQVLAAHLDPELAASIFVVLHVPAHGASVLPSLLARAGPLPASHARDGEAIEPGRIYVAPPDLHLLLDDDAIRTVRGPKENGHRPAVDPLFRSAARRYGRRVVGIVLSGALDDGTAGLTAIKRARGLTIVQDPTEAAYPSMPMSAIESVSPDHVLRVAEIGSLVNSLDGRPPPATRAGVGEAGSSTAQSNPKGDDVRDPDLSQLRPGAGADDNDRAGHLTRFTCPECNGSLWEMTDGDLIKLRCRVGHTFTEETMLAEQARLLEAALWTAMTALEEKADFSRRLAARFARQGHSLTATRYEQQAQNAVAQMELLRRALLDLQPPPSAVEERQAS